MIDFWKKETILWVAGMANAPRARRQRGWPRGRGTGGWPTFSPGFVRGRGGRGPYRGARRY